MQPGEIYRHEDFYLDKETGRYAPKYFVVLARTPGEGIVARLLTSRAHGRPEYPPFFHGNPYPGFYLGVLAAPLGTKSWIDLRWLEDFDVQYVRRKITRQQISLVTTMSANLLIALLDCAANADDTTRAQEQSIRNQLASLR